LFDLLIDDDKSKLKNVEQYAIKLQGYYDPNTDGELKSNIYIKELDADKENLVESYKSLYLNSPKFKELVSFFKENT
jgi:hypothetical protein